MSREVDKLIAENFFGIMSVFSSWVDDPEWTGWFESIDGKTCRLDQIGDQVLLKHYSTTWEFSGLVVEIMKHREMGIWWNEIHKCWVVGFNNLKREPSIADTAPMAICLAALKAKGIEVPSE